MNQDPTQPQPPTQQPSPPPLPPVQQSQPFMPSSSNNNSSGKKKLVMIAAIAVSVIGLAAVALFLIVPALKNSNQQNDTAATEQLFNTSAFFVMKDKKYALADSKQEKRLTDYIFDKVSPFINGTALVEANGKSGILKDDGSMLVELSDNPVRRSGAVYWVGPTGSDSTIIDGQGKTLHKGADAKSSSLGRGNWNDPDAAINPIITIDGKHQLFATDGKTQLTELKSDSIISNNFNYGNYSTFQAGDERFIVNNKEKKIVAHIELSGSSNLIFKAASDHIDSGSNFSTGKFDDLFIAKLAGRNTSDLSEGISNIITGDKFENNNFYIIRGSEVVYEKKSTDCAEMFTVIFPGDDKESVICRPESRTNVRANTKDGGPFIALNEKGEAHAQAAQFIDKDTYMKVASDTKSIEFFVHNQKVKTYEAGNDEAIDTLATAHQGFMPYPGSGTKQYLVIEKESISRRDTKYTFILFDANGNKLDELDGGTYSGSGGATVKKAGKSKLFIVTTRETVTSAPSEKFYDTSTGKFQENDGSTYKKTVSGTELTAEWGPASDNERIGKDYGSYLTHHDKDKGIFYGLHDNKLIEIKAPSRARVVFAGGREPLYLTTGSGSVFSSVDNDDLYYLSGKKID